MEWTVIATSVLKCDWVWVDLTKYKELHCNILIGNEEYVDISIPTTFIIDTNRTFYFNAGKSKIIVYNNALFFDGEGEAMSVIVR